MPTSSLQVRVCTDCARIYDIFLDQCPVEVCRSQRAVTKNLIATVVKRGRRAFYVAVYSHELEDK